MLCIFIFISEINYLPTYLPAMVVFYQISENRQLSSLLNSKEIYIILCNVLKFESSGDSGRFNPQNITKYHVTCSCFIEHIIYRVVNADCFV